MVLGWVERRVQSCFVDRGHTPALRKLALRCLAPNISSYSFSNRPVNSILSTTATHVSILYSFRILLHLLFSGPTHQHLLAGVHVLCAMGNITELPHAFLPAGSTPNLMWKAWPSMNTITGLVFKASMSRFTSMFFLVSMSHSCWRPTYIDVPLTSTSEKYLLRMACHTCAICTTHEAHMYGMQMHHILMLASTVLCTYMYMYAYVTCRYIWYSVYEYIENKSLGQE